MTMLAISSAADLCQQLADIRHFYCESCYFLAAFGPSGSTQFQALLESEGFAMHVFILLGSKGGAGRTTSSVVLAAGLAAIGLRPLHLQVAMSGVQPVIALAKGVPFSTAAVAEHGATPAAIRHTIAEHPECSTVVIDMVKRPVWETVFDHPESVALFPMKHGSHEVEVAVRDYRDLRPHRPSTIDPGFRFHRRSALSPDDTRPTAPPPSWLLPVAWPQGVDGHVVAAKVARFDGPMRASLPGPSILTPGIPYFPRDHLDDLINTSNYKCSSSIGEAAVVLARSVSQLCF